jgi:hypothetical protein
MATPVNSKGVTISLQLSNDEAVALAELCHRLDWDQLMAGMANVGGAVTSGGWFGR